MALSQVGGGYQFTDGNVSESTMVIQGAPATATAAATLTVAQLLSGIVVCSSTPGTQTLPTVALLEATLTNSKVDAGFEVSFVNTAGSTLTLAAGTGWTIVGTLTAATVTSALFRARKTGDGAWTLYRIA
ncbi:hypothetical protein UFOVP761_46 [uncultured Caudovirales phage]|jgi:hypothetical protein|uniref:Uncharacterized protein n=1 Tax=uncultured Caudovirales phage TaxID=2100421 RepID=A0A6J5NPC8_9CAUD|nr:hypothetical protein UFOVP761_46 [uncultured Caudovirales phage]